MRNLARRWAAPAVLCLLVILVYWRLTLTHQYTFLEGPDHSYQVLPWMQYQAGEWHRGRIPLWDPTSWIGQPLLAQVQPTSANPLSWTLFLAPLEHGWIRQDVLHWYFVLIRILAALTCYALLRDLGRSRMASIVAGCVFALGGYLGHNDYLQKTNGVIWAPLALMFLLRVERGIRPVASAILSGFFLGMVWLGGHHEMPILVSVALAGLWLWFILRRGRPDLRMARMAALALLIATAASALQTLPAYEYGKRSLRWVGLEDPITWDQRIPYSIHEKYSLRPAEWLELIIPQTGAMSNPFVGITALSLALLGLVLGWRVAQVRWFAILALLAALFSIGPSGAIHPILYTLVPMVEKARVPAAATIVFALGLAPLVAFGVDSFGITAARLWTRRLGRVLFGMAAVLATITLVVTIAKVPLSMGPESLAIPAASAVLCAAIFAGYRARGITLRVASVALLAVVLFELSNYTSRWLPHEGDRDRELYLHRMREHADLAQYIRGRGEAWRVDYDTADIPYNFGSWFGLETFNAYVVGVPQNLWSQEIFTQRFENLAGIRYYLGKKPKREGLGEVYTGTSGVKIFENYAAFPRAWSVHEALLVPDRQHGKTTLADPQFAARDKVFLVGKEAPALATCPGSEDEVDMPSHRANRVTIRARLGCRGMVILSDNWFPGWHATVDGEPAEIHEAYGVMRGVVVDAGNHTIEMTYLPASIIAGALLTFSAALVAAGAVWRSTRERGEGLRE
jgi:hypothetical protein